MRSIRRLRTTLVGLALPAVLVGVLGSLGAFSAPSTALASGTVDAPAGNSSVNQYVEDVPTAGGGKPASSVTVTKSKSTQSTTTTSSTAGAGTYSTTTSDSTSGGVSQTITHRRVVRKTHRPTASAAAAAALAAATKNSSAASPLALERAKLAAAAASSPTGQVLKALGGSSGGLGSALPVLLIGILIAVSGAGIMRRRHSS